MNNPLFTTSGPGLYSSLSKKNKADDLSKIKDWKEGFKNDKGRNKSAFPSKAVVINLRERTDRWQTFQEKNQDLFSKFFVERFDAFRDEKDVRNAIFLSHLGCLEKYADEESILVLEDDCELVPGWYEKLQSSFSDLPEDWDVLIGNHYSISSINILSEHLAKPELCASTTNLVLYNGSALNKINQNLGLKDQGLEDIDHFLTDPITPIINYTVWPMISREFESVSDHYGKIRNMEYRVREHAYLFQYIDSEKYYPSIECW